MKDARAATPAIPLTVGRLGAFGDYVTLAKPRLNMLVVATSAAGYYLGATNTIQPWPMAAAIAGTALVAGGAAALNQVYERDTDALMRRTRQRPLPDRRIAPREASLFGAALALVGVAGLAMTTNVTAAALAAATIVLYLAVYTPMKRRSSAATLVGAIPGALPPLIGWTAAHGSVAAGGAALFAIVFLWQIPHFMAIAWMLRDDYGKAGFPMLTVIDPEGRRAGQQALYYSMALVPVSLLPTLVGVSGWPYFWLALPLGLVMLWLSARFASTRSENAARQLFYFSITYLPVVWTAMVVFH